MLAQDVLAYYVGRCSCIFFSFFLHFFLGKGGDSIFIIRRRQLNIVGVVRGSLPLGRRTQRALSRRLERDEQDGPERAGVP